MCAGPSARQNAENEESAKWLDVLSSLGEHTIHNGEAASRQPGIEIEGGSQWLTRFLFPRLFPSTFKLTHAPFAVLEEAAEVQDNEEAIAVDFNTLVGPSAPFEGSVTRLC